MREFIIIVAIAIQGCAIQPSGRDRLNQATAVMQAAIDESKAEERARAVKRQGMIDRGEITGGSNEMPDYWLLFHR